MNIRKGENSQIPKIIYLTFLNPQYSRSAVNFQDSNSIYKFELIQIRNTIGRSLWDLMTISWENRKQVHAYVVMSPCHILVIILRIVTRKKIILDAGWSMTEATLARNANKPQLFKSFLVDFLSFHFANLVLLESRAQIEYSSKLFRIRKTKLKRLLTGFNEKQVSVTKIVSENISNPSGDVNSKLQIIFRGSYNSESGIEIIIEAAKKFVAICTFVIVCRNFPKNIVIPSNVIIMDKYLIQTTTIINNKIDILINTLNDNNKKNDKNIKKIIKGYLFEKDNESESNFYKRYDISTVENIKKQLTNKKYTEENINKHKKAVEECLKHPNICLNSIEYDFELAKIEN